MKICRRQIDKTGRLRRKSKAIREDGEIRSLGDIPATARKQTKTFFDLECAGMSPRLLISPSSLISFELLLILRNSLDIRWEFVKRWPAAPFIPSPRTRTPSARCP